MKLSPLNQPRAKHNPVRSFTELAQECGKTIPELRGMMNAEDAPKCEFRARGVAYYEPVKFVAWVSGRVA